MTEAEMDDEWEYDGYRMGRAKRTVEVDTPDGSRTIEEGAITFDPINRDDHWCWEEDSWIDHYFGPDPEGAEDMVHVPRELVGIIEFPHPMTQKEAWEWLDENPDLWRQHLDDRIVSDVTAADLGIPCR